MPTRRDVLHASAVAGAAASAGCGSLTGSSLTIESWTPDPGSWPLPNYDPANTSHNPHANPPRLDVTASDPWKLGIQIRHLLVADGYVIGAGLEGIRMVRPPEHGRWWNDEVGASAIGIVDGTLYAATPTGVDESGAHLGLLRGVDFDNWWDESHPWATFEMGPRYATQLLPTADAIYIGYPSYADEGVLVLDADSGARRARLRGYTGGIANETVYTSSYEIVAYQPRTGFLEEGFHNLWETPWSSDWTIGGGPTIADGVVLLGGEAGDGPDGPPAVRAVDAQSGDEQWTTAMPSLIETNRSMTAAANGRVFVGAGYFYEPWRLVALDLGGDGVQWTAETEYWFSDIAVAGDVLLVAGGVGNPNQDPRSGQVTAFDTASGDQLWEFGTEHPVAGIAPVEDVVYVGTDRGDVFALRAN